MLLLLKKRFRHLQPKKQKQIQVKEIKFRPTTEDGDYQVKLRNLRERPATSILWRAGWRWAGVDGTSELIGPGDTDAESLRLLLRAVFTSCGGTHDDWDTYDRVMREEGRVAVLVTPTRVYGNA